MTSSQAATLTSHPRSSVTSSERRCARSRRTHPWASQVSFNRVRLQRGLSPLSSHASPPCCCLVYVYSPFYARSRDESKAEHVRRFSMGPAGQAISPAKTHHSGVAKWLRPPCEHASITQRLVLRHAGRPEPSHTCPANGKRIMGDVRLLRVLRPLTGKPPRELLQTLVMTGSFQGTGTCLKGEAS